MNRIKEIRERVGLTQKQLAKRVRTTNNTISRLEVGEQQLTQAWMMRLAEALECGATDLIANMVAYVSGDVAPAATDPKVAAAIEKRGLRVYRVMGESVIDAGIAPGDTITVDESEAAIKAIKIGDVVLAEIGPDRSRVLRQFVPPRMLVTNRRGSNVANSLNDPTVRPSIVGVLIC